MTDETLACFSQEQRRILSSACVGIAGAGGLGSNVAVMLARSGVGSFVLVDDDVVEPSNLNRQHYFPRHLGMPKINALSDVLHELDPAISIRALRLHMDESNLPDLMPLAGLWVEAVDTPKAKQAIVSAVAASGRTVVCGSGMGGFGGGAMTRRIIRHAKGLIAVVGDMRTDISQAPPLAPRVMQCAAMQADAALEFLLTGDLRPLS